MKTFMHPKARRFHIVVMLAEGRVLTAADIMARTRSSERVVYRDIKQLRDAGLPVKGEAGVGYLMRIR